MPLGVVIARVALPLPVGGAKAGLTVKSHVLGTARRPWLTGFGLVRVPPEAASNRCK